MSVQLRSAGAVTGYESEEVEVVLLFSLGGLVLSLYLLPLLGVEAFTLLSCAG